MANDTHNENFENF